MTIELEIGQIPIQNSGDNNNTTKRDRAIAKPIKMVE